MTTFWIQETISSCSAFGRRSKSWGKCQASRRRSGAGVSRQERIAGPLFVSPFFLVFAAFGLFPVVFTLWVSLHDWSLLGDRTWVGLDNYRALVEDDHFWNALTNTLGIFVLATVPQLLMALGLAALLNEKIRDGSFDFLKGTLGAQMLRESLRKEVWKLEPSPLRVVD